jgi:hypothetical protein
MGKQDGGETVRATILMRVERFVIYHEKLILNKVSTAEEVRHKLPLSD